ncbi:MAG TPA: sigma 54-interacting transcriptional regulator [Vicinamibacterales bacterium]
MTSHTVGTMESLQLAIEVAPTGILIVEPTGKIVVVNRELERQLGYARAELVGECVDVLVPDLLKASQAIQREDIDSAAEARRADGDLSIRLKDGTRVPVEIGLNPIQTPKGLLILISVVVTARRGREDVRWVEHEQRLAFERLVAELSSRFIGLEPDSMDRAIRDALRQVCELLDCDRGTFVRIADDAAVYAESWAAPGVRSGAWVPAARPFPWMTERILAGEAVLFSTIDDIPSEIDRQACRAFDMRSGLLFPLAVDGRVAGAVAFDAVRAERAWSPEIGLRLQVIAGVFSQVLACQLRAEALRRALAEMDRLKDVLQSENVTLRLEARECRWPLHIVGRSPGVRQVLEQIQQVASTDSTVLLLGETGTGKELFATQIHELSKRCNRAMVRVNSAAIPTTLIESELFGREKGAFTGALARQIGRFELADHSTIFLDEIGDLPSDVQVKLLRVLEEHRIERLGSPRQITVDVRIIAASRQDLEQRIASGAFRADLYYRLNVFPIHLPPLRERTEDIPLLVWRFVHEFSRCFGTPIESIDKDSLAALQQYAWPGNIRELRNVVERAMIGATTSRLTIALPKTPAPALRGRKLVDVEKEHIRGVLENTGWRVRGLGGAAERLGLKPTTLETRMAKLGLRRPHA